MKVIKFLLVGLMFGLGFWAYPQLSETLPIHWNFQGQPDNYGSKAFALFMFPAITLLTVVLFPFLSKIDPKRKNYQQFERAWQLLQVVILLMFVYFYGVQLYVTFYPDNSYLMTTLMLSGLGLFFVMIGNFLGKIRQNYFIGVRTPWALNDGENWQKTQRFSGWLFILVGMIMVVEAWLRKWVGTVFFISIFALVVLPFVYSFWLFRKK